MSWSTRSWFQPQSHLNSLLLGFETIAERALNLLEVRASDLISTDVAAAIKRTNLKKAR